MTLTLIAGFCFIAIEIWYDLSRFKRKANDKPQSTIVWLILVMVLSLFLPGWYHHNVFLFIATRFLLFDFALNVVRWDKLPEVVKWSVKARGNGFVKNVLKFRTFINRLFWHGIDKKKLSYDWIMGRVPWYLELFVKLLAFTSAILIRYEWSIIDEVWYWFINLFS